MRSFRHASKRRATYICLSCRLQSQSTLHPLAADLTNSLGLHSLQDGPLSDTPTEQNGAVRQEESHRRRRTSNLESSPPKTYTPANFYDEYNPAKSYIKDAAGTYRAATAGEIARRRARDEVRWKGTESRHFRRIVATNSPVPVRKHSAPVKVKNSPSTTASTVGSLSQTIPELQERRSIRLPKHEVTESHFSPGWRKIPLSLPPLNENVRVRKQWGTPFSVKQKTDEMQRKVNTVEDLLVQHRALSEGKDVVNGTKRVALSEVQNEAMREAALSSYISERIGRERNVKNRTEMEMLRQLSEETNISTSIERDEKAIVEDTTSDGELSRHVNSSNLRDAYAQDESHPEVMSTQDSDGVARLDGLPGAQRSAIEEPNSAIVNDEGHSTPLVKQSRKESVNELLSAQQALLESSMAQWEKPTNEILAPSSKTEKIAVRGRVTDSAPELVKIFSYSAPEVQTDEEGEVSLVDVMSRYYSVEPANNQFGRQFTQTIPAQRQSTQRLPARSTTPALRPNVERHQARLFHTSRRVRQQAAAAALTSDAGPSQAPLLLNQIMKKDSPIRMQLRQWQELHGNKEDFTDRFDHDRDPYGEGLANNLTRLPNDETSFRRPDLEEEEERQALAHFMRAPTRDLDSAATDTRFLKTGDLVELEFLRSERESMIAVFVRRLGYMSQFFTMSGRWVHIAERFIQYSIPGWISPDLVKPLLPYLPDPRNVQEAEKLEEEAYVHDLSVPREVAAGIVSRMVQFHTESQEIYRRHASALDNAHAILAHETDLRYGSLLSAATALLKMRADELPVTALFTVRKALTRAGFAFNIDRRSHRLTGYLQIRSKEQVTMVEEVRGWLRDWQDDMAKRSTHGLEDEGNEKLARRHRTPKTAQYVYDFVQKARKIVLKSRENRDPTPCGNIGPSKKRFPITPESDCVKVTTDTQFSKEDTELVRFMEAWACSSMFLGLPRIEALPPLILQATGLYNDMDLNVPTGCVFLQELGTIMPYENRVRFDQHLLLPSSQHSKPLQKLMGSLLDMKDHHDFSDSMKHIRRDWKELAVYCIDKATAHEIDDGLSVEQAGVNEWWVHIHIANPTAFFERDHPLAKMARHMGESIYMPERTYMMLPRWATSGHFSLSKDRPSLTFSVRMDAEGNTLERKVQPGIVRNVFHLTNEEVNQALELKRDQTPEIVLTVGGEPPPVKGKTSRLASLTEDRVEELKVLRRLAEKRSGLRRKAGGVFFDMKHPDVEVWQRWKGNGLAWDHPHRKGSRTVEGDPVIRMRTQGLVNWFQPSEDTVDVLVREMMLLACETAARWCAERQVPAIFRGVLRRPDQPDPEAFLREVLLPATKETADGAYPMHLGIQYMQSIGSTVLNSKPFKHAVLGMDYYGKVTSPLRRYGDMILHWQIEAALREESRTGKSLVTEDAEADRRFLPFSANVLDTIMLGLQPREKIVTSAKAYAEEFWVSMLLFRAFHFNEIELPFYTEAFPTRPDGSTKPLLRVYIHTPQYTNFWSVNGVNVDLNIPAPMLRPERFGLEEVKMGDTWECELDLVDVYRRGMYVRPVRLVDRPQDGTEKINEMMKNPRYT